MTSLFPNPRTWTQPADLAMMMMTTQTKSISSWGKLSKKSFNVLRPLFQNIYDKVWVFVKIARWVRGWWTLSNLTWPTSIPICGDLTTTSFLPALSTSSHYRKCTATLGKSKHKETRNVKQQTPCSRQIKMRYLTEEQIREREATNDTAGSLK